MPLLAVGQVLCSYLASITHTVVDKLAESYIYGLASLQFCARLHTPVDTVGPSHRLRWPIPCFAVHRAGYSKGNNAEGAGDKSQIVWEAKCLYIILLHSGGFRGTQAN